MSLLSASCLGETQTFPSAQENTLICSQCWSLPVPALFISCLLSLTKYDSWVPSYRHYFLLEESLCSFSHLPYLKGLPPVNHTVTHRKEATSLQLNSIVAKQNKITESEKDVELLTISYKCCSSHP